MRWATSDPAIAHVPVCLVGPQQDVDVVVGQRSAPVVPFIHDDGLLVGLREEIALEIVMSGSGCIGHVDIGNLTAGGLMHPFRRLPSTQSRLRSSLSSPMGTTFIVLDPEVSGRGPTVSSMILPAAVLERHVKVHLPRSAPPRLRQAGTHLPSRSARVRLRVNAASGSSSGLQTLW